LPIRQLELFEHDENLLYVGTGEDVKIDHGAPRNVEAATLWVSPRYSKWLYLVTRSRVREPVRSAGRPL
jgi:hypothetical protein